MERFCRGCLVRYDEATELLQYTEKNRRLFVYSTGLQVKRNDIFTFQLCKECYFIMKQSCKFKKQCRTSDKKFKNYLMVKEDVDDFESFIKNMDVMGSLSLPFASGHSTPAYKKNKDDDNDSTCTSIRNFMTDILEGEEMPPTEARIIREVIEEEADVLDDSLDSHWLQDDITIGSDFDVDFGISPFGTPRSAQNNEFSTPSRISEEKQRELYYLTSKEIIEKIDKPRISQKFDMPLLDVNMDFEDIKDDAVLKSAKLELPELDNSIPSEVEDMVTENSLTSTLQCFKTDILVDLEVKKELDVLENDNANFVTLEETKDFDTIDSKAYNKTFIEATDSKDDICIVLTENSLTSTLQCFKTDILVDLAVKKEMDVLENDNANFVKLEETKDFDTTDSKDDICIVLTENSLTSTLQCFKTDILVDLADKKEMDVLENDNANFVKLEETKDFDTTDSKDDICIVLNQGTAEKKADIPLPNELEYYVNKAEIKRQITTAKNKSKEYHCSIDRNLDIALKHVGNKEISLDQLIISPAASIRSGVSTPTINNILFGDKDTETVKQSDTTPTVYDIIFKEKLDLETVPKVKYFPQVGQSIENLDDIKKDMKMLDDFIIDDENTHLRDDKTKDKYVKTEPEDTEFDDNDGPEQDINHSELIETEDHTDVLEKFLQEADDNPTKLNEEIINRMIDPIDLSKELSDQDLFKRPLTPPYDKYDLEKCLCKICSRTFVSSKSLKIHFAKIHKYKLPNSDPYRNKSQNSKITMCNDCGKNIKGVANYIRHKKRHQDKLVDFFECDNCTLFFNSRMALRVHMKMHMGLEPKKTKFLCNICGRKSATQSHHKLHLRRHLKKVSDTCDVCHKGFYSAYDLKVHMRKHSGEKPYACQYCYRTYKRRDALYQHVRRHLGKLEFKCEVCEIEFVSKRLLAQHYGSQKCIKKRAEASQNKEKVNVSVIRYGKGSLENIKKIMRSNELKQDTESYNDQIIEELKPNNMSIDEDSL